MPNSAKLTPVSTAMRQPAMASAIHTAMARTPSQPMSGTGRGNAGWLMSSCKNTATFSRAALMLSSPCRIALELWAASSLSLSSPSHFWKSVRSERASGSVATSRNGKLRTTKTARIPAMIRPRYVFCSGAGGGACSLDSGGAAVAVVMPELAKAPS